MNPIHAAFKTVIGVGAVAAPIVTHVGGLPPEVGTSISPQALALLAMVIASFGGAYASFSWGDPVEPRSKMARLFVSCVIIGLSLTSLTNAAIEAFTSFHLTLGSKTGLSAVVSCLTRFIMPKVIESIKDGTWRNVIPFIAKKERAQ